MYIFFCITIAGFNLAQSKIYLETCPYALRVSYERHFERSLLPWLYGRPLCVESGFVDKNGGFYDLFTRPNIKLQWLCRKGFYYQPLKA